MDDEKQPPSDRLKALAAAFQALNYRETMDLAEVFSETLEAINKQVVKPQVFAEVFDGFGVYLEIEVRTVD